MFIPRLVESMRWRPWMQKTDCDWTTQQWPSQKTNGMQPMKVQAKGPCITSSKQKVYILPCRQDYIHEACKVWGDTPRPQESGILIRTHTVTDENLLWKLLTARGAGSRSLTRVQQAHLTFLSSETAQALVPASKCTFLIFNIMLLFNKLFTPCLSDEASRGL